MAAMFVALPSAIAFGLSVYSPLGESYAGFAALSGILGTILIGLVSPLAGGTPRLISAPCAPAAAVLSVFVLEEVRRGSFSYQQIPILVGIAVLIAGLFQIILGLLGGGRLIKYIPYPVVAGYLSGLGLLLILSQLPRVLAISSEGSLLGDLQSLHRSPISPLIGLVTVVSMVLAPKFFKKIPPTIFSLIVGVVTYWTLSLFYVELRTLENNHYVVGPIMPEGEGLHSQIAANLTNLNLINASSWRTLFIPSITLGFLLSIDTLKTCLVLDVYSEKRHDSNRELLGQGLGNCVSSVFGGIAGAGTLGASLVNVSSGAKSKLSGFFVGVLSLVSILFFSNLISWIPVSALASILIVIGFRMIDWKSVGLLRNQATLFDFFVILCVVISAVSTSLLLAAGVGIILAILLFLRDQVRSSVVRRSFLGNQKFSKKRRLPSELDELLKKGDQNIIFELQGQLFFGTTDQLLSLVEPYLNKVRNMIFDFRRILNLDFTAVNLLKQIHQRLANAGGTLILTSVPQKLSTGQNVQVYLESFGLSNSTPNLKFFEELDEAIEFVEDEILHESNLEPIRRIPYLHLRQFEFFLPFPKDLIDQFETFTSELKIQENEVLFKKNDISDQMYFIRKGSIRILLPLDATRFHHLATFGKGDFFGDMAFLDSEPRSADAIALEETMLYVVSRAKFDEFVHSHPKFGYLFFESLSYILSQRLRLNHLELSALQEN